MIVPVSPLRFPSRGRTPRVAFACLVLLAATFFAAAAPAAGPLAGDASCVPRHVEGLGKACPRADGLWDVLLEDGTTLSTHGVDPLVHDHGTGMAPGDPERAPSCATDYYQHVLYGRGASAPDRFAQSKPVIVSAVRRMNHVLNEEALLSGGVSADFKVRCDAEGAIRVDAFTVPSGGSDFDVVVGAARAAGFTDARADHTIFFDGSSAGVCGVGSYSADERPGADNRNNAGGGYGVTYVGCWTGRTPMHENGHNQGAVQRLAPDTDAGGHCIEGHDVMCYPTSSVIVLCRERMRYDCDNDSYFDAAPEPGEWLATHWNIGSRVNRFIRFGDQAPVPPQPPALSGSAGEGEATLSWTAPDDNGHALTGYRLYRDGALHRDLGLVTSFVDAGLVNGQTYRYRVSALSSAGEGGRSDEVSLRPGFANQPPVACFAVIVTSAGTSVDGACSSDPDGSIHAWTWVWGDGTPNGTGAQASHAYQVAGSHTLRLVVTDDRGATASHSEVVVIEAPQDPDPSSPTLASGKARSDSASGVGAWKYYKVLLPDGASGLTVDVRGSGCVRLLCDPDLDLYLKRGARPTTTAFDCRAAENGQAETCLGSGGAGGLWYVGVYVESGSGTGSYAVTAYW